MGKFSWAIIVVLTLLILTAGCDKSEKEGSQNRVIVISERMFISQVNDIYMNRQGYLGRTVKIEGIFVRSEQDGNWYNFVGRNGPNCCVNDQGFIGLEVSWDRNQETYPEHNSWVEATGIVTEESPGSYVYLDLISLTELQRRGREQVFQ